MADMKALVTGSSSGIGLAISTHLLEALPELEIVGLSRRAGPLGDHPRFNHWTSDLGQVQETLSRARRYKQEVGACDLLVYAAGLPGFSPMDGWDVENLQRMMTVNLTSPMTLVGELLPTLNKAPSPMVCLLGSTSSRERSPLGAAYAASKAGLHKFAESLFAERRKSGLRVLHLCPGMTDTPFYESERFEPKPGSEFALTADAIAQTLLFYFSGPGKDCNPTHLVLEPQKVGVRKK